MGAAITYTESELVLGLKARNEKHFGYLYDHYSPALYGIALKVLNDESAAGDVLQEIFLKIWRSIERYDADKGRLFTWMVNIARNTAIDTLRSRAQKSGLKIHELGPNAQGTDQLAVLPVVDHLGLAKVVEQLNKEQRVIIDLAYYKGCTQEEIARILDIPLGTVKTRMRNAVIQLRNILKQI